MEDCKMIYTLCFIKKAHQFLMLYRNFPPNAKQWNGVGGKIEAGETPEQAIRREILEETGLQVDALDFRGTVTWNDEGGMYVFLAETESESLILTETQTDEGILDWKPLDWVLSNEEVVSNIPLFLPAMLDSQQAPREHAFTYEDKRLVGYQVRELPAKV